MWPGKVVNNLIVLLNPTSEYCVVICIPPSLVSQEIYARIANSSSRGFCSYLNVEQITGEISLT